MDSLHVNSERGRFIGNLVSPSRGLRVTTIDIVSAPLVAFTHYCTYGRRRRYIALNLQARHVNRSTMVKVLVRDYASFCNDVGFHRFYSI